MSNLTLLVMAAGIGSRYGGLKQIEPVSPAGETIIDYSVFDALREGFNRVVFVIGREIEDQLRESVGSRFEGRIAVEYIHQELESMPAGFTPPENRKKPWGTAHAILAASNTIREPFAVINADDFYGRDSFRVLAEYLRSDGTHDAMVGFTLRNTLSSFGTVKRGVCCVDGDDFLLSVIELERIEKDGNAAKYTDATGAVRSLTGDEIVSMNMWGFRPELFPLLFAQWLEFLRVNAQSETAEFYIPNALTALIEDEKIGCRVLQSMGTWFGMTYREDHPLVVERIRGLVERAEYPASLWS